MSDYIYNIIIVSVFIFIIILLITWTKTLQEQPPEYPNMLFSSSSYGMRCISDTTATGESNIGKYTSSSPLDYVPQPCEAGLICDKIASTDETGICRKKLGQPCTSVYECSSDAKICFNGFCSATITGGINQPPPCINNLISEDGLCKVPVGGSCSYSTDCFNSSVYQCVTLDLNNPSSTVCTIPYENGQNCLVDSDCASNNCSVNNSMGVCQPEGNFSGEFGSSCLYYQAQNQNSACQSTYSCNLDLFSNTNTDIGVCLRPVYTWPNNTTANECITNSCITPSICYDGICKFPDDPLSCAKGVSSGNCISNFNCVNDRCEPNFGYPGVGNTWKIVQWVRSVNNEMGYWNPWIYLDPPGSRPSVTSYDHSAGTTFIYAPDVSSHTTVLYNYYQIINQTTNKLTINYIYPSDWNISAFIVPYNVHYTSNDTTVYVALMVSITVIPSGVGTRTINYVVFGNVSNNILTVTLPAYSDLSSYFSRTNLMPTGVPKDFTVDLRGLLRIGVIFPTREIYAGSINTTEIKPVALFYYLGAIYRFFNDPGIAINFYDYKGVIPNFNYFVYATANNVEVFPTTISYGVPTILNMNSTTRTSDTGDIEVLFTSSVGGNTLLNYAYGENWVTLPIDIPTNAIPLISLIDPLLNSISRFPNLFVFTTVK
jgi:hypothetical protein